MLWKCYNSNMKLQAGKEHLVHREFKLPKGYSVESFVIREIDGHDEKEAARLVAALGTADDLSMAVYEGNLRVSIVDVNGEAVEQPYMELSKWSTKTRKMLMVAWNELNGVPDEELAAFLGAAVPAEPVVPEPAEMSAESLPSSKTP